MNESYDMMVANEIDSIVHNMKESYYHTYTVVRYWNSSWTKSHFLICHCSCNINQQVLPLHCFLQFYSMQCLYVNNRIMVSGHGHNLPLATHAAMAMSTIGFGNGCKQFKLSHKPGVAGLNCGGWQYNKHHYVTLLYFTYPRAHAPEITPVKS